MKRTNLFKAMATILAVAMIIAMVPMAAMAATNTVTVGIEYDYDANKAVVKGSIASGAELTMVTVLADEELTSLDGFSDTDLENAIMYIDQITSDGTEKTWTFDLRDTASGNVLTAFVGGTDATVAYESVKILAAAPAIAPAATEYFSDETITFTVTDAATGWSDAAEVYVNGTKDESASVSDSEITFTANANVTKVEVKNADYQDAKWEGTVTVKDRYTEAKKAVKAATAKYTVDDETIPETEAWIYVPADETDTATGADIAYTVTVDGVDATVEDGKVVATRPADDGDADNVATIDVVITATITKDGSSLGDAVEQTIKVREQGADGVSFTEDQVEVLYPNTAYKAVIGEGSSIVIVTPNEGDVDAEASVIKVAGEELYYAPVKGYYIGIISNIADDAAVLADIVVEDKDGGSDTLYYGKATASYTNTKMTPADYGIVKQIVLKKLTTPTDKQLLASDVGGGALNGNINPADFGAFKRVVLKTDDDLAINVAE